MKIEQIVSRTSYTLKKHGPLILSVLGAAGVILTAKLASDAGKKIGKLEAETPEFVEYDLFYEEPQQTVSTLGLYLPTIVCGVATIGCILSSSFLSQKRQMSLIAAYAALDAKYKEIKKDYYEKHPDEYMTIRKKEYSESMQFMSESDYDELLYYDEYGNRWFKRRPLEMMNAAYQFNRQFILKGYANLNDYYILVGLEPTVEGATIGWSEYNDDGYAWVDIVMRYIEIDDDDAPGYYQIEFPFEPSIDYLS
jgi:hypothetical protein